MVELDKRAMLVCFSVSQWTARKYDKKASHEVAELHRAPEGSGRYNKQLVAKEEIAKIESLVGEARRWGDTQTLPWNDNGSRILPVDNYFGYTQGMRERREKFEMAVEEFLLKYPALIEQARRELNGLFNEKDYPKLEDIRSRFDWAIQVFPIPTSGDFRVELDKSIAADLQGQIDSKVNDIIGTAQKDLWSRLYTVVKHMADTWANSEAKVYDSAVDHIVELCGMLPKLNLAKDPKLEEMRLAVEAKLCQVDPERARKDKKLKVNTAKEAQSILDTMASFMGGGEVLNATDGDGSTEAGDESPLSAAA